MLIGVEDNACICLMTFSGLRKPIDWRKDCRDIVITLGRAALTLSAGRVVRGVPGDGTVLMCLLQSIGCFFIWKGEADAEREVAETVSWEFDVGSSPGRMSLGGTDGLETRLALWVDR
jgi:hypothetical protein